MVQDRINNNSQGIRQDWLGEEALVEEARRIFTDLQNGSSGYYASGKNARIEILRRLDQADRPHSALIPGKSNEEVDTLLNEAAARTDVAGWRAGFKQRLTHKGANILPTGGPIPTPEEIASGLQGIDAQLTETSRETVAKSEIEKVCADLKKFKEGNTPLGLNIVHQLQEIELLLTPTGTGKSSPVQGR